jgi:hypothetical protein
MADRLAVTMTGELCDCFRTKMEGVRHILEAVSEAAADRELRVYLVDGRFVSWGEAFDNPQLAAASNWRALAEFACRYTEGRRALLVDIGSTTTDIVPLVDGQPRPVGLNDTERLLAGELVYTGVCRTAICALTQSLPWHGQECPVTAELFATTADAYVLLSEIAEQPEATCTADGRPLTVEFARERLARMICADVTSFEVEDARRAAESIRDRQIAQLRAAFMRNEAAFAKPFECVVISGEGEFLGRRVVRELAIDAHVVSLAEELGSEVSRCAPAHALGVLAAEEFGP